VAQLVRNWGDCFYLTGCNPTITGSSSGHGEFYRALQGVKGLSRCIIQTFDQGLRTNRFIHLSDLLFKGIGEQRL
jgi:hypothetical protein